MKEFIKSILLVILTISAIFMTKSIFVTEKAEVPVKISNYETSDLIAYIRPQNYIFSFGDLFIKLYGDEYIYGDAYNSLDLKGDYERVFNAFMSSPSEFTISQITDGNWEELSQRKSMMAIYPFNVPLSDLLALYDYNAITIGEVNDLHVTSFLFLLNSPDTLYIYDGKNELYYRLTGQASNVWIDDLYEEINQVKSPNDIYRTIESRYNFLKVGLAKYNITEPNLLLTPLANDIYYPKYETVNAINFGEHTSDQLEGYAKSIFGEDLSFVKKSVYADQSTIFIYGYGEKVFKANADGSLEYIVKAKESNTKSKISFIDGLTESLEQISKMGLPSDTIFLSNYYQIETPTNIETVYLFNYSRNGIPFFTKNTRTGDIIEARFSNQELVKVKKNTKIITAEVMDTVQTGKNFKSLLERNRIRFEFEYKEDRPDLLVDDIDIFQMALQEMTVLDLKYYYSDDELIPVWLIKIADTEYIIDITSGQILDYYSK